jgi:hypothetical protein
VEAEVNAGKFIQWHDLFVIIDDGSISAARYRVAESAMREQVKMFPQGIACLGILPADAKPPPEETKRLVKDILTRMAPSLSCIAYVIEGTGWKGVAARAALIGMKIFSSRPYPIYVDISLRETLEKVLPHLHHGRTVTADANAIAKVIDDARMGPLVSPPRPGAATIAAK